jgi:hypothetical protein
MVTILLDECLAAVEAEILLEELSARVVHWKSVHPLITVRDSWVLWVVRHLEEAVEG